MSDVDLKYEETLKYIFQKLPMFLNRGVMAVNDGLSNIIKLMHFLDNPHTKFKSIHVGGTNGKGSITHFLASILVENNLKVGIYTSPHLIDYRERIKIGSNFVEKEFVIDFIDKIKPLIEENNFSYFEISVAMAFSYFEKQNIDIAVIEVGLGGLKDSTNIIYPLISVISNISIDHTNILGNSLEQIAIQKAGIIKENSCILIGERQDDISNVFIKDAKNKNSKLFFSDDFNNNEIIIEQIINILKEKNNDLPDYFFTNYKTAIAASIILYRQKKMDLIYDKEIYVDAFLNVNKNTKFIGRWHKLEKNVLLECSHNEAGIKELNKAIEKNKFDNLLIIYATMKDKDITKNISLLPKNAKYILTSINTPRAMNVDELRVYFKTQNLEIVDIISNPEEALAIAKNNFKDYQIIITGSMYLVSEFLKIK